MPRLSSTKYIHHIHHIASVMPKLSRKSAAKSVEVPEPVESSMEASKKPVMPKTSRRAAIKVVEVSETVELPAVEGVPGSAPGDSSMELSHNAVVPKVSRSSKKLGSSIELSNKTETSLQSAHLWLDELDADVVGTIVVMIGRVWDVSNVTGRFLSTDFVASDSKGQMVHCTARANVAHNFHRLKEGSLYSVRNFVVLPNKDDFRVFKDHKFMLEFNGETIIRKISAGPQGYVRYPFQLVELEDVQPANNRYMIDVVGYVTNIRRTMYTKSGTKNLDFTLANQRGQIMRVTLWGNLGDVLVEMKTKHLGPFPVVLAAVSPKDYNNKVYLSSSSSTVIYDNPEIPCIQDLEAENSAESDSGSIVVDSSQSRKGTLENLLIWARNRKNDSAMFQCKVKIEGFRTKKGWNYPSCESEKCKKGASRQDGRWRCDACNVDISYPVFRYRLEVVISDETAHTVVVMFDETATELIKAPAQSLMAAEDAEPDSDNETGLPLAMLNVIGTEHVLEIKSHTYFEYGSFESFNCWSIIHPDSQADAASSTTPPDGGDGHDGSQMKLKNSPTIATPSKAKEDKKKGRAILEESDTEDVTSSGNENDESNDGDVLDGKAKKMKYAADFSG